MKLKVNNLGAIKEGEIDLSQKLIVFCGPNGTGKTYLSYVIYGLLKRRLHIQGDEDFAERLINEKNIVLEIDFEKLFQYRNNMIRSVETSLDELFGIGESEVQKIFKDFHCEFTISDEDFKAFKQVVDSELHRKLRDPQRWDAYHIVKMIQMNLFTKQKQTHRLRE